MGSKPEIDLYPYLFNHHYDSNNPNILAPYSQSVKMAELRLTAGRPADRDCHGLRRFFPLYQVYYVLGLPPPPPPKRGKKKRGGGPGLIPRSPTFLDLTLPSFFSRTDLGELGGVEAGNVDSQRENTIRTVYTQLPAGLEQSGYRHIYVTVDNPSDISTLTSQFATQQEVSLNQSNIVTVAVPASQLLSDAGTIIIHPSGGGETLTPSSQHEKQHAQIIFSEVSSASEVPVAAPKESQVFVSAPNEKTAGNRTESQATSITSSSSATFTLSNQETHSESVEIPKVSHKELDNLISSQQTVIVDRPSAPVPLVVCRCDARKKNTRTDQKVSFVSRDNDELLLMGKPSLILNKI